MRIPVFAILLAAAVFSTAADVTEENLVPDGDFENIDLATVPRWKLPDADALKNAEADCSIRVENGNSFLHVESKDRKSYIYASFRMPIGKSWKHLEVTCRMRARNLQVGKKDWQTAQVLVSFQYPEEGKRTHAWSPSLDRDSDWLEQSTAFPVPADATQLELEIGLFGTTGSVDFDDLRITTTGREVSVKESTAKSMAAPATKLHDFRLLEEGITLRLPKPWEPMQGVAFEHINEKLAGGLLNQTQWRFTRGFTRGEDQVLGIVGGQYVLVGIWPGPSIPQTALGVVSSLRGTVKSVGSAKFGNIITDLKVHRAIWNPKIAALICPFTVIGLDGSLFQSRTYLLPTSKHTIIVYVCAAAKNPDEVIAEVEQTLGKDSIAPELAVSDTWTNEMLALARAP